MLEVFRRRNLAFGGHSKFWASWFFAVIVLLLALVLASCGGVAGSNASNDPPPSPSPQPPPPPPPPPPPVVAPKVVVVVEENKAYSDIIGNTAMPFLNSLVAQGGLATNFFAVDHPSLPNYFMLTVGQTVVSHTDIYKGPPGGFPDDNIVRELKAAGKTWKSYAESLPSVGYLGGDQDPYIQHHNPFVLFSDVIGDPSEQQNIVPLTQLATDLAAGTLPDYSFIVPNNRNNSHDCPPGVNTCSDIQTLGNADAWLKTNVGPILDDANFKKSGVMFIVYDESSGSDKVNGGGHVACVLAGGKVKAGFQSATLYQHQSLLRTALMVLGVTSFPGQAATAPDMSEFLNP